MEPVVIVVCPLAIGRPVLALVLLVQPVAEHRVVVIIDVRLIGIKLQQLYVVQPLLLPVVHQSRVLVHLAVGPQPIAVAAHVIVVMVVHEVRGQHVVSVVASGRMVRGKPVVLVLVVELVVAEEGLLVVIERAAAYVVVIEGLVVGALVVGQVLEVVLHRLVAVGVGQ